MKILKRVLVAVAIGLAFGLLALGIESLLDWVIHDVIPHRAVVGLGYAVLGLAVDGMPNPPKWAVVRNMSDPQINGGLPNEGYDMNPQTMWAIGYYTGYGYYTSVSGAIATWGVIAGL